MLQGLRVALAATILAAFLHTSAATPARAELSAEMLGKIEAAVQHDTIAAVVAALQGLFAANPSLAPEIARAAVDFDAGISWACAFAAASATPICAAKGRSSPSSGSRTSCWWRPATPCSRCRASAPRR